MNNNLISNLGYEILINQNNKKMQQTNKTYLDARYWNIIFEQYPNFGTLKLKIKTNKFSLKNDIQVKDFNLPIIVRLRISVSDDNLYKSVHNNVIIINPETQEVIRYEPCIDNKLNYFIDTQIKSFFMIDDNNYKVVYDNHCIDDYCVAHSLRYALDYVNNIDSNNIPIINFVSSVEYYIGELNGTPVIEKDNRILGGAVIGGLAGGLAGGAGGLLGGALLGGAIGGLSRGF